MSRAAGNFWKTSEIAGGTLAVVQMPPQSAEASPADISSIIAVLPTQQPCELPIYEPTTVAEAKAYIGRLSGVPADNLVLFACAPLPSSETIANTDHLYIAIGHEPLPPTLQAGSRDAAAAMKLAGLLGHHYRLQSRLSSMRTALALDAESRGAALVVRDGLREGCALARIEEATLRPALEVAELQAALCRAENRAATAERRAKELERQLDEARRLADSLQQQQQQVAAAAAAAAAVVTTAAGAELSIEGPAPRAPTVVASAEESDALLAQIRKEKAADIDIPAGEASVALDALRGALHRSLTLLAEDLYRDDVHCISELLQNADDNEYAPGVEPTWALHVAANDAAVWTTNNEKGMTPSDVRALCDAGNSSKRLGEGRARIGRKGVGFKSVFKLSSSPHVLSAGFRFRFDLDANGACATWHTSHLIHSLN